jgi:hypothetical protein
MRRLRDILIALAIVGLCVYGVTSQFSADGAPDVAILDIEPLEIGALLEVDFTLRDLGTPPKPRNLMGGYGRTATVLYSWSEPCPCILDLEPRLRALAAGYEGKGVRWIALAGEPRDTLEALRAKAAQMKPFYPVYRDPEQRVLRRLDIRHAGQFAVLDGEGRLVFRGGGDDHWEEGKAEHLQAVLDAVVTGQAVPFTTKPRRYGCEFSLPASCLADEAAPEAEKTGS